MSDKPNLRDLFAESDAPTHRLDPRRVIAASRRRRLPRQVAAAGIGVLAITGIGVLTVQTIAIRPPTSTVSLESQDQSAPEGSTLGGTGKLIACSAVEPSTVPAAPGLELELELTFPPTASAADATVNGVARVANTGPTAVTITPEAGPIVSLSRDGEVLWSGDATGTVGSPVILNAGDATEVPVAFVPTDCGGDGSRLAAGVYDVSVTITVSTGDQGGFGVAASGPITIHLE
jgi:hypothetical protein